MRTEHLELLLDLQNTLSLNKTAENFYTSHQVINNAIKSLENELNCTILNRSPRGVSFTTAGLSVCYFASKVLAEKDQLLKSIAPFAIEAEPALQGELDIHIIPRFSNKVFFSFYTRYCKKNPKVKSAISTLPLRIFYGQLPAKKPFVFLVTLHTEFIQSDKFKKQLEDYQLTYEIISEQKLGYCVAKHSKWLTALNTVHNNLPAEIPYTVFNFAIGEDSTINDDVQFHLIDSFESQKELIKNGDYVGICTPWEYKNFFQTKNSNLLFIPNSATTSDFYYAVLYSKKDTEHPLILDVIKELKKFFK